MDRAVLLARHYAKQIIEHDTSSDGTSAAQAKAASRACEELRVYLSKIVGTGGYTALASRALSLAREERGLPAAIRLTHDGVLEGFSEATSRLEPVVAQSDAHSIVSQL